MSWAALALMAAGLAAAGMGAVFGLWLAACGLARTRLDFLERRLARRVEDLSRLNAETADLEQDLRHYRRLAAELAEQGP